jgi:hypothetical protein
VLSWRSCTEDDGDRTENIAIRGSHIGMSHNPILLAVLTERLAAPDEGHRPYAPNGRVLRVLLPRRLSG